MSCEVVAIPQAASALSGAAAAAAPAVAGLGLAYATFKVAQKLRSDYQSALQAYAARQAAHSEATRIWAQQNEMAMSIAVEKSLAVESTGESIAASQFVSASLQEVIQMAQTSELESFRLMAQELMRQLAGDTPPEALISAALKLRADLHTELNRAAAKGKAAPEIKQMFAAAKEQIQMVEAQEERAQLVQQLEKLEALPVEEHRVALQGLTVLSERTGKILQAQIAAEETRVQRREITSQAVALLQALSKVPDAPEAMEAVSQLEKLNAAFASAKNPTLKDLQAYLDKAQALFDACEARLKAAMTSAQVTDTVAEVLLEMGYSVSHVAEEGSEAYMVTLDDSTGMMVTMDRAGQLKTEMVAFTEAAREQDLESQEKVCSLVDEIFDGLRKRDIQVKEKFRKTMKHGKLKLVAKPQEATAPAAKALKERALT